MIIIIIYTTSAVTVVQSVGMFVHITKWKQGLFTGCTLFRYHVL